MPEIAKSERQITLFYSSDSVRAKKVQALARTKELPIREIDILATPLTGTQILEIAENLHVKVSDLVNQEHPYFKEHFGHHDFDDASWLKMIEHNPQILKQPIAMRGGKTVLIETPTDILQL